MDTAIRWEQIEGGIARITLDNGPGNPLNQQMLGELEAVLDELEASPPRAVILAAEGRVFSGGLDVLELLDLDPPTSRRFFRRFVALLPRIVALPMPTVCAVSGSAVAGGFLLSLTTDFRVVGDGRLRLGLSEVDLGLAVPAGGHVLLAARTSEAVALRLAMFGALVGPDGALEMGYAESVSDDPQREAVALATALAAKPGSGAALTKSHAAARIAAAMRRADADAFEAFLGAWMSPTAQTALRALASSLRAKRASDAERPQAPPRPSTDPAGGGTVPAPRTELGRVPTLKPAPAAAADT